jgi:trigger factor
VTASAKPDLEVEVETQPLEGGELELSVRVAPGPVAAIRDNVVKAVSRRASVPGFRKGKAPRALLERLLDQDYIKEQVIDALLADAYDAALEKAEIKSLGRAQISDTEITDEGALTFKAVVVQRPEITIGEYKGLAATKHITPVTDEQVQAELDRLRGRLARYENLPDGETIAKGDLAIVDYDMFVEGEKREEGSATGYPLEVGADELFPQLNDTLPGARPGDVVETAVTYPESHPDKEVAGRTATFKVKVQQARRRQLPPLDDAFAARVSKLDTAEALRNRVRENLVAIGGALAEDDVRSQLLRQVSESASLDVPDALVQREAARRVHDVSAELERRGEDLHDYLRRANRSYEDWRADMESEARQEVRQALVLDEIGTREGIEVSDEEVHEEVHRRAQEEGAGEREAHERMHDAAEVNRVASRVYHRKIIRFLIDNANVTEEVVEPEAKPEGPEEAPAEG